MLDTRGVIPPRMLSAVIQFTALEKIRPELVIESLTESGHLLFSGSAWVIRRPPMGVDLHGDEPRPVTDEQLQNVVLHWREGVRDLADSHFLDRPHLHVPLIAEEDLIRLNLVTPKDDAEGGAKEVSEPPLIFQKPPHRNPIPIGVIEQILGDHAVVEGLKGGELTPHQSGQVLMWHCGSHALVFRVHRALVAIGLLNASRGCVSVSSVGRSLIEAHSPETTLVYGAQMAILRGEPVIRVPFRPVWLGGGMARLEYFGERKVPASTKTQKVIRRELPTVPEFARGQAVPAFLADHALLERLNGGPVSVKISGLLCRYYKPDSNQPTVFRGSCKQRGFIEPIGRNGQLINRRGRNPSARWRVTTKGYQHIQKKGAEPSLSEEEARTFLA